MAYMSHKLNGKSSEVFHLETSDTSGYAVDWHAHDCSSDASLPLGIHV